MIDPLHIASLALLIPSVAYLSWRTLEQHRRQRASYAALPFPPRGWLPPAPLDRPTACLLAIALADAQSMHREFIWPPLARLRWGASPALSRGVLRWMRRAGTVSDDTQHTWLLATCIQFHSTSDPTLEPTLDVARWRAQLAAWWGWRIGPGKATEGAIKRLRRGVAQSGDPTSQGNGAAMRVAPLAIAFGHDTTILDAMTIASATPTHAAPEAVEGARQTARLIAWCLRAERWSRVDARAACEPPQSWDGVWAQTAAPRTSGWVRDTLGAALWLLDRHHDDIDAGLTTLFTLGGDVDTIGAIYASCAAALHGALPASAVNLPHIQGAHLMAAEATRLHAARR